MTRDTTPNRFVPGTIQLSPQIQERINRRDRVMGPAYRLSYAKPVHFVRGEGIWLYDESGDSYLDFYNNVVSLGHCHPRVAEAMTRQAATLATNTRYLHDTVIEYSERLTDLFPRSLSQVTFACSGSEANDLACRIAQHYTGGGGFIVTEHAYHGTSSLIAGMSPNLGSAVPLHPQVRTVPVEASLRGTGDSGAALAAYVEKAAADLLRHGVKPAAFLVDSLFSSDGIYPDPPGFLAGAVEVIKGAGGLFIADEVQSGFARSGDAMWGFQRHCVKPDIVTLGKPMGNGYPMSGIITRPEIAAGFGANARYFNTFAGNSVAAANGLAVLDVIRDEDLLSNSRTVGAYLKKELQSLSNDSIGEVRGAGLFVGIEIVNDRAPDRDTACALVNALRAKKILISTTGIHDNILKVRPPLVATTKHVDHFLEGFAEVLREETV